MQDACAASTAEACVLCGAAGRPWLEKRGFRLRACAACGVGYLPPAQRPRDLAALYSSDYFEGQSEHGYPSYLRDRDLARRNFDRRLDWIEGLHAPGRLLEVGAAYGFFLAQARRRGWDVLGVEIAPDCAAEAERQSGARVLAGDFLEAPLSGPFDVVCMFDVIEHLPDPLAALRRARELLADGGMLVVETGDRRSPWARLLGRRWYFVDPPQHLVYFDAGSLVDALRRAGFGGPVHTRRLGRRVSLANIAFKAFGRRAAGAARLPGSLYLNFGDALLVAATR
jgi:SAM-dependent methyltransferase